MGAPNALMFDARISASIEDTEVTLEVHGMNDFGSNRQSHTTWLELAPLERGDVIGFRFTESEQATRPTLEVASDSEEHLIEQAKYEKALVSQSLAPRQLDHKNPHASLKLFLKDQPTFTAVLESGREYLSFSTLWNQWHPERCRVSLSSYSQAEAIARSGTREWFNGYLYLGDECSVEVCV